MEPSPVEADQNEEPRKRARTKNFTIQHKILIIDLLDGTNYSFLNPQRLKLQKQENVRQYLLKSQQLRLGRSTISEIYKNKDHLVAIVQTDSSKFAQKSLKTSKYHELEVVLAQWVISLRKVGHQVSGDMIQVKALELAKAVSIDDFKASCGWLCKFKERFKLRKRHSTIDPESLAFQATSQGYNPPSFLESSTTISEVRPEEDSVTSSSTDKSIETATNSSCDQGIECLQKAIQFLQQSKDFENLSGRNSRRNVRHV